MIVVLDASAAVQVVLNGPQAALVAPALAEAEVVLAPDLLVAEVANALWKYVRAGQLDAGHAVAHLADATKLVSRLVPMVSLSAEALSESVRLGHPVHDVLYLVTARREAAALATLDRRLGTVAASLGLPVIGLHPTPES